RISDKQRMYEARTLVAVAVMILVPDVAREQIVQRRDRLPPARLARHLRPLRVLRHHGIDNRDEGFIAGENPVTAGEQVAFEPALAAVLTENLHHAPVARQVLVGGD